MTYWRMQLHPSKPQIATEYAVISLTAGFIGLDFGPHSENLLLLRKKDFQPGHRDYLDFAHAMKKGDYVLIIVHHFPFALVKVAGPYNYIRRLEPRIGVWFKHFRKVEDVLYYGDYITNVKEWQQIKMTDTISILRDQNSDSYKLIIKWLKESRKR